MPLADVEHQHVLSFDLKTAFKRLNNHRLKPEGLNYGLKVRIRVA